MRNCSHFVSLACCLALAGSAYAGGRKQLVTQVETHYQALPVPKGVHYEFSRTVRPGRLLTAHSGKAGSRKTTWRITYKDGKVIDRELLKEELTKPEPALVLMSRAGFGTSRGGFVRRRVLNMVATAYDPSPETIGPGATGRTRTGMIATFGHVAVDPRVIPLGSLVYVEGYGFAIASDTGGAIKGNRIDLCYDSRSTALAFGRKRVKVHILKAR